MAGVGPVPANASSVALNVTTVGARTPGYLQVLPTMSAAIDGFSSLNLESIGQVLPNFVISPVSANGRISIYSPSGGDVLVDVLGYFVPAGPPAGVAAGLSAAAGPTAEAGAGRFVPLTPHRVLDTRQQVELRPDVLPVNWTNHKPASREVVVADFLQSKVRRAAAIRPAS